MRILPVAITAVFLGLSHGPAFAQQSDQRGEVAKELDLDEPWEEKEEAPEAAPKLAPDHPMELEEVQGEVVTVIGSVKPTTPFAVDQELTRSDRCPVKKVPPRFYACAVIFYEKTGPVEATQPKYEARAIFRTDRPDPKTEEGFKSGGKLRVLARLTRNDVGWTEPEEILAPVTAEKNLKFYQILGLEELRSICAPDPSKCPPDPEAQFRYRERGLSLDTTRKIWD